MKYTFSLLIGLAAIGTATAQDVPDQVLKAFTDKYPNTDAHWESEDEAFEAEFKIDGTEVSAFFTIDGSWFKTEKSITVKDLPKDVLSKVKKNYGNHEIDAVEWVVSADGEYHRLELENGTKAIELKIFPNGKMTVKPMHEEDDEDD